MAADTIGEYVDQLEDDAGEIVQMIDQLYHSASKGIKITGRSNNPLVARERGDFKKYWEDPNGHVKDLQNELKEAYEVWYTQVEVLISKHLPERLDEYQNHRSQMRDYIRLRVGADDEPQDIVDKAIDFYGEQRLILKSIPSKIAAEKFDLRRSISSSFSKDEIQRARELLDEGLTRAAGIIAGVALERHLQIECDDADLEYDHNNGIAALAHALYDGDQINSTTLKSLETLGGIRNDCAHANPQEPNEHKVRRLIDDTNDYIRGRGI